MASATDFVTLWRKEFPEEEPPGMKWNREKTTLTISCDTISMPLDCPSSFISARNSLLKKEGEIFEMLERILYCKNCLNVSINGTSSPKLVTKTQLIEAVGFLNENVDDPKLDHVYDVYEMEERNRTKSEVEERLAPNMYSRPLKDRTKPRSRPPLENVFINNGVMGNPMVDPASGSAVGDSGDESTRSREIHSDNLAGDAGYDAVYEAIDDVQINRIKSTQNPVASKPLGGSLKMRSPLRPFVPQRTCSLNRASPVPAAVDNEETCYPVVDVDRPYQSRPRTVYVENPTSVAPPLPHRYHLPVKKVNSCPANDPNSPDDVSVFTFEEVASTSSPSLRKRSSVIEQVAARHLSRASDVSEGSTIDSNYERVAPFNQDKSHNTKDNGIYYSPVPFARSEDHDGIYEDISEASRLANTLAKESEMRGSSSSLISDDGVLATDELRNMIHSFCPEDADAVYASLPRRGLKDLTCPLTFRGPHENTGNYDQSLPEIPSQSANESLSMTSTASDSPSSSTQHAEEELDLDEMLGVLEDDSQRKIYVASILDNEKEYLQILGYLIKLKKNLSLLIMQGGHTNMMSLEDLSSVFFMIAEIHKIHEDFASALEVKMSNWSPDSTVAEIFQNWIRQLHIYEGFLRNYSKSLQTLRKCKSLTTNGVINDVLRELNGTRSRVPVSLEDFLMWPVNRMQRTSLYIEELLKRTPESNSDKLSLTTALSNCSEFFSKYNKTEKVPIPSLGPRRILKSGFHVESDANGVRKLRLLVLFTDAVACFKQVTGWGLRLDASNKMYQLKWAISLGDLSIAVPTEIRRSTKDIDQMKSELQDLTIVLQKELAIDSDTESGSQDNPRRMSKSSNFKRMKKNWEQKLEMWSLESPCLVLLFWNRRPDLTTKRFSLLMSSDWTRQQWREAIDHQIQKYNAVYIHHRPAIELDEIEDGINKPENKSCLPEISAFGSHLMEKDKGSALSGILSVKVGKAEGLTSKISSFCRLEVDQYNNFEVCAKTNLVVDSSNPHWNDEFPEIQLRSSHKINILMYKTAERGDEPIARGSFNLAKAKEKKELLPNQVFSKTVELLHQQENYLDQKITVSIEVIFFPTSCLADDAIRTPKTKGYFGVLLKTITEKEKANTNIPLLVALCVAEIEKRGLDEQGIYRVNGYIRGINKLKQYFEEGSRNAAKAVGEADVHVITGVLKTFFRELPHPLFTDLLFPRLTLAIEMTSPDLKRRMMLDIFQMLPEPNKSTAYLLLSHLVKIPPHGEKNKMSLHALATIFGPTLVRPPPLNVVAEDCAAAPSHIIPTENLRIMQAAVIQNSCVHLYLQYLDEGYDLLSGDLSETTWDPQSQLQQS